MKKIIQLIVFICAILLLAFENPIKDHIWAFYLFGMISIVGILYWAFYSIKSCTGCSKNCNK